MYKMLPLHRTGFLYWRRCVTSVCTGWSKSPCSPDYYNTLDYMAQSDCLTADSQGQGDTRLTLTPSVIPNSNYVIMVSDWNCLRYFCMFLYCNHEVHRDFLITLYIASLVVAVVTTQECISMPPIGGVDYAIGSKCFYLHSSSMQNKTTSDAKFRLISYICVCVCVCV
jgi:hypothetical protein